ERNPASSSVDLSPTGCSLMNTRPRVGVSMQPIRLSSVDLPLPDGPASAKKTPDSILMLILRSAVTVCEPIAYSLDTFSRRTIIMKLTSTLLAPLRRLIAAGLVERHSGPAALVARNVASSQASTLFQRHVGA